MSTTYLDALTPVSDTITTQEGGVAFALDDWNSLTRFLILGTDSGTFYVNSRDLTLKNAEVVKRCLDADGGRTVSEIVQISVSGRAPKNDPAIFALALAAAHTDSRTRKWALDALPHVCRTGTHLLHFMAYCKKLRKSSRMYRTAIGNWFNLMDAEKLAYQAVKYKQRDGWSMADALRIARPTAIDEQHNAIYKWIVDGVMYGEFTPALIRAVMDEITVESIREFRIPREAVPTEMLNDPAIWDALLADMPMTAMIRNLAKMTAVGLIVPGSEAEKTIRDRLEDTERIRKTRVHPIALLNALRVYEQGHGDKGSLRWTPSKKVVGALDEAFYLAFGNVEPTGKRICLALDVSASMDGSRVAGTSLTARDASAAMALVTAAVEPNHTIVAYSHELVEVRIKPSMRLDEVIRGISAIPMRGTLCQLPLIGAANAGEKYDAFVSYTDSETGGYYYGYGSRASSDYPTALRKYRAKYGKGVRSIVVGTTATEVSLNDPLDRFGLDVCGFDTATPGIISDFIAGRM